MTTKNVFKVWESANNNNRYYKTIINIKYYKKKKKVSKRSQWPKHILNNPTVIRFKSSTNQEQEQPSPVPSRNRFRFGFLGCFASPQTPSLLLNFFDSSSQTAFQVKRGLPDSAALFSGNSPRNLTLAYFSFLSFGEIPLHIDILALV